MKHEKLYYKPDPNAPQGVWEGWGVSLCWWAKVFGEREDLADLLFTQKLVRLRNQELPGLGLNIVRYNAGACGNATINNESMVRSPSIPDYRQIECFWMDWGNEAPDSDSWNWEADPQQRTMLGMARDRGADRFELFSNSPPWWMCLNHNPSGSATGKSCNLQDWNFKKFAIYLATIVKQAAIKWSIDFTSVAPFNEPSSHWWKENNNQEGCHFDLASQAKIIGILREELDKRCLGRCRISASDENTYDLATKSWKYFGEGIRNQIGQVNVHGYQGKKGRRDLLRASMENRILWNSEYGDDDASGRSMAANLHLDFRWLRHNAWCYWQAIDSGGWGLIASNPGESWIGNANIKHFVIAHYSRHIRPGMLILKTNCDDCVCAWDEQSSRLAIVVLNLGSERSFVCDLSYMPSSNRVTRVWETLFDGKARYREIDESRMVRPGIQCILPENSIMTFDIRLT